MTSSPLPYSALLPWKAWCGTTRGGHRRPSPSCSAGHRRGTRRRAVARRAPPRSSHDRRHPTRPRLGHRRPPRAAAWPGHCRAVRGRVALSDEGHCAGQGTVDPGPSDARAGRGGLRGGGGARHSAQRSPSELPGSPPQARDGVCTHPFEAFCGFRPTPDTLRFSRQWRCRSWRRSRPCCPQPTAPARIRAPPGPGTGSRPRDRRWPHPRLRAALGGRRRMVRQCRRDRRRGSRVPERHRRGSVALLNYVRLAPKDVVFVPPGTVHCYLGGLAVEVMASSDNVLRAASRLSTSMWPSCWRWQISTRCRTRYADRTLSTRSPGTTRRSRNSSYPSMSFRI